MTPITRLNLNHQSIYRLQKHGFDSVEALQKFKEGGGKFHELKSIGTSVSDNIEKALKAWQPFKAQVHIIHQAFEEFLKGVDYHQQFVQACEEQGYSLYGYLKQIDALEQNPAKYPYPLKVLPKNIAKAWELRYRNLEGIS